LYIDNHLIKVNNSVSGTFSVKTDTITLADEALFYCKDLTCITIPDSVASIGNNTFRNCINLENITISESVTSIGGYAFFSCNKITDVYYTGKKEDWSKIEIKEGNNSILNAKIHYADCPENSDNQHNYTSEITTPATHLTEGIITYTCTCGDSYTKKITRIEAHTYTSEIKAPATHFAEGIMTYTCECGNSYTEKIPRIETHSYTSEIITPATHFTEGVMLYTCLCGDSYTKQIDTTPEHSYFSSIIKEPDCNQSGIRLYYCECGHSYTESIAKVSHIDKDNNSSCDLCGAHVCDHLCHKTGFMGFIWNIVQFFWKLFKMNPVCECGMEHY